MKPILGTPKRQDYLDYRQEENSVCVPSPTARNLTPSTSLAMAVCRTAACGLLSTAALAAFASTPRMPSGYADVPNKRCVCVCVKGVKCCKRWSLTEAALLASSEARSKERYS